MVATGAAAGLTLGLASVRYIESSIYQVKGADLRMLLPSLALMATALVAALPAIHRAVHVDPVKALRSE
jgi:ABC-type antimicrobial peptide transport system permease subunit